MTHEISCPCGKEEGGRNSKHLFDKIISICHKIDVIDVKIWQEEGKIGVDTLIYEWEVIHWNISSGVLTTGIQSITFMSYLIVLLLLLYIVKA